VDSACYGDEPCEEAQDELAAAEDSEEEVIPEEAEIFSDVVGKNVSNLNGVTSLLVLAAVAALIVRIAFEIMMRGRDLKLSTQELLRAIATLLFIHNHLLRTQENLFWFKAEVCLRPVEPLFVLAVSR